MVVCAVVVCVVVVAGAVTRCPTVIVTVEPCCTFPCVGSCARTRPSCCGSVTSCWITDTDRPACCSSWVAVCWSSPVTDWIVTSCGPLDTLSVTVDPTGIDVPADGLCATTVPSGAALLTSVRATLKLAPLSAPTAFAYGSSVTSGTPIVFGPVETLMVTVSPTKIVSPAAGLEAVTLPEATLLDGTLCTT